MNLRSAPAVPVVSLLAILLLATALPAQSVKTTGELRQHFKQAMQINARPEMVKLLRSNPRVAPHYVLDIARLISSEPSDELEEEMAAIRRTWKDAFDESRFADRVYEYFSLMTPTIARERAKIERQYFQRQNDLAKAEAEGDAKVPEGLVPEFEGMAKAFEELGDYFLASQAWMMYGRCNDDMTRKDDAVYAEAARGYAKAVEARDRVDLKDPSYHECKDRYAYLTGTELGKPKGEGGESGGGGGGIGGSGGASSRPLTPGVRFGAESLVPLQFEALSEVQQFERPSFSNDEVYTSWSALSLQGAGSKTTFSSMKDLSPSVVRVASSKVGVDVDRDGAVTVEDVENPLDVEIPLQGKVTPVVVEVGKGDDKRQWAFFTMTGSERDTYQGIQVNFQPTDQQLSLYINPAASMVGQINGQQVRILDDNMDGVYGSPPSTWAFLGLSEGRFQADMDSMVIGTGSRAVPWSEFQQIGGAWYKLEPQKGGKEIKATAVEVETGFLKLSFKGPKPEYLIVKGQGTFKDSYFDLADARGKGAEVPVGKYELFQGLIRQGKRWEIEKALVLPSDPPTTYAVTAGQVVAVELGAPFEFDFQLEQDAATITIPGNSVVVRGRGGEVYQRLWGCAPRPEVSYRKVGQKRGSKPEAMPIVLDQDTVYQKGFAVCWGPLDLVLEKKNEEPVEVQLLEEKNELFGKIESPWKD